MENKLMGTNVVDSIEKVLRYIIPGVAFFLLFALYYPDDFDKAIVKLQNGQLIFSLAILTIGISIYLIHKMVVVKVLDFITYSFIGWSPVNEFSESRFNPCAYSKAHSELLLYREKKADLYPKGYAFYLWATTHYSLIMSELLIIFAGFLHDQSSSGCWIESYNDMILWVGIILGTLSSISFIFLQYLEKNIIVTLKKNEPGYKKKAGNDQVSAEEDTMNNINIEGNEIPYKLFKRLEMLEEAISSLGDAKRHVGIIRFKPLFISYNSCLEEFIQHFRDEFKQLGLEELPLFDDNGNMLFTYDKLSTLLHQTQAVMGFLKGILPPNLTIREPRTVIYSISSSGDSTAQASAVAENQVQITIDIFFKIINELDFNQAAKQEILQELNELKKSRKPDVSKLRQLVQKFTDKIYNLGSDKFVDFITKLILAWAGLS